MLTCFELLRLWTDDPWNKNWITWERACNGSRAQLQRLHLTQFQAEFPYLSHTCPGWPAGVEKNEEERQTGETMATHYPVLSFAYRIMSQG